MGYHLRIILDTKEDVFKDVVVDENKTLLDLHNFIKKSFQLPGNELASYYTATEDWEQNQVEISLENFSEEEEIATMKDFVIKQILTGTKDKLIYVYDLFLLWTFFVEVIKITDKKVEGMKETFSFGEMPKQAPEKQMDGLQTNFEEEDLFDDDDDNFDLEELDGMSEFDTDDFR
jgi:hypothetical protein